MLKGRVGEAHRVSGEALDAAAGHAGVRQVEGAQVREARQVAHRRIPHSAVLRATIDGHRRLTSAFDFRALLICRTEQSKTCTLQLCGATGAGTNRASCGVPVRTPQDKFPVDCREI